MCNYSIEKNAKTKKLPMETFDVDFLKSMSMIDAKKYIDKHWIVFDNGDHALVSNAVKIFN